MNFSPTFKQYNKFCDFSKEHLEQLKKLKDEGLLEDIYEFYRSKTHLKYSYSDLNKHAKQCTSRFEFKLKFPNIYECVRRNNLLDPLCSFMSSQRLAFSEKVCRKISEHLFKESCIINTRKIIPPYELDVYFPTIKIAIEFQGDFWHSDETIKKRDLQKQTLCDENGILLIHIYEKGKSHQDNLKLITEQFVEKLPIVNNFLNKDYKETDILKDIDLYEIYMSHKPINLEKEIANFSSLKEFSKNKKNIYDLVRKTNKIYLLEKIRERSYPIKWKDLSDDEIFKQVISNFKTYKEFRQNEKFRTICRRRNLTEKIKKFFRKV